MPDEQRLPSGPCLEPEVLAAYVEHTLTPDERARAEAHLAECGDCYALLTEVMRTIDELEGRVEPQEDPAPSVAEPPKVLRPVFGRRRVWTVAGGVFAAAAALLLVIRLAPQWLGPEREGVNPKFVKLISAIGNERTVDARLTGGFAYGELRSPVRAGAAGRTDNFSLLAAAGELQQSAQANPSAENLHGFGVGLLLLERYDESVATLEQAVDLDPRNAELHANLSAAYLGRARALGRAQDVPASLASAERSLELRPHGREALFNRAVALEMLHLIPSATEAWRRYLVDDVDSPWAVEARNRLAVLEKTPGPGARWRQSLEELERSVDGNRAAQLAADFPWNVREWLEDVLLAQWARHEREGQSGDAARVLDQANILVTALANRVRDPSLLGLIAPIEDSAERTLVACGFHHYAEGRRLYDRDQIVASRPHFRAAIECLSSTRSSLLLNARLYDILITYFEGRLDEAARLLSALQVDAERAGHQSALGRIHWLMGIIHGSQTRFSESILEYQKGLEIYTARGEKDLIGNMHNLIADALTTLGDPAGAWDHIIPALSFNSESWNPRRRYNILVTALRAARMYGMPEAARTFHWEILENEQNWGPAGAMLEAHVELARAEAQARGPSAADAPLQRARALLDTVTDKAMRWRVETQFLRAQAEILADDDPARAVGALESARRTYQGIGSTIQLAALHLGLGRAYRRVGRLSDAERELRDGIELVEKQRGTLIQSQLRVSHFDRVWDLFEEMVALQIDRGDTVAAFEFAERGRARTLMDIRGWNGAIPSLSQAAAAVSGRNVLIYTSVLRDRWVAWIVSRDEVRFVERRTPRASLERLANRIIAAQSGRQPEFLADALEAAHDEVVAPIRQWLPPEAEIYIAADGPLQAIPFAALRDRQQKTFFGIQHAIAFVPNARALLGGAHRAASRTHALVVGVSGQHLSGLRSIRPLPFAEDEARLVARDYAAATLWTGARATPEAILRDLPDADIVHFAGHAIANAQYPLLSHLLLSPSATTQGELYSYQLAEIRLKPWSTVVLAACATASGRAARGEGPLSLARPFITGGASEVVATMWDLPDAEASSFFNAVHAALRSGEPAHIALWHARKHAVERGSATAADPAFWGGIVAFSARGMTHTREGSNGDS